MPFSEFVRLYKCASMLNARENLIAVNVASFANMKDSAQKKFSRDLRTAATEFMERKVKDYREVLGNLARVLNGGK